MTRRGKAGALVVAAVTLGVFASARHMGLVGDDLLILERVQTHQGLSHPTRYFEFGFFSFYRPITFLSYALDWELWRDRPFGYHQTNVLLHAGSALMTWLIARRLVSPPAATMAALLFALHASNHEAVFWIAGRFDLLATFWTLVALLAITGEGHWRYGLGLVAFAMGLLSKESALSFPIIVAAYDVFVSRLGAREIGKRQAGIMLLVALYAWLRWYLAGLDPIGGTGRLPKAAALAAGVVALVWLGRAGWQQMARWLLTKGRPVTTAVAVGLSVALALTTMLPATAGFVREKLAFAAFALFYLSSPIVSPLPDPILLDADSAIYSLGGLFGVLVTAALVYAFRRPILEDGRLLWTMTFVAAALVPVSSMTEGQRYLYLGSAATGLLGGLVLTSARDGARLVVLAAAIVFMTISAWQIGRKARDWIWAGRMTHDAIRLVDADLSPSCQEGHVVLLTAPVGIRGVYTHFYRESFGLRRGCPPESFTTLVRMLRKNGAVEVGWNGRSDIIIRANRYDGNFVLSRDLRHFTLPLRDSRSMSITTPLGELRAYPDGTAEVVRLHLSPAMTDRSYYYYTDGRVERLAPKAWAPASLAQTGGELR